MNRSNTHNGYQLDFYLAADAVMYLPVFVAKEKGLFENLIDGVQINVSLIPSGGDFEAISRMEAANRSTQHNNVAIAIADPNAMVNPKTKKVLDETRAIGALIGCPSFWALSNQDNECDQTGIKQRFFTTIVYYDENYYTGYRIGKSVASNEDISDYKRVKEMGKEFDYLQPDHIIISPDLLNVAINCVDEKAYINYHFAKDRNGYISSDYLTTAIITSKRCIENKIKNQILVKVIVALQTAKAIIYSSDIIAREILTNMSCIKNCNFDEDRATSVARKIVEIIDEDHLYPFDFNISEEQWSLTTTSEVLKDSFTRYVNNDIVLNAEKIIARQFGITATETFADVIKSIKDPLDNDIFALKSRIVQLEEEFKRYKSFYYRAKEWVKKNRWTFLGFIVTAGYSVTWLIATLCYEATWTKHPVAYISLSSIAIPTIRSFVSNRKKRNNITADNQ